MAPVPISTMQAAGFDVSSPDGKNGERRRAEAILRLVELGLKSKL
jgi:hypothetical protein